MGKMKHESKVKARLKKSFQRRVRINKPLPPLSSTSRTSSVPQTVNVGTQKSADAVEDTEQESHKESTKPVPNQESEISEPPTRMPQNSLSPGIMSYPKDQELFPDPSPLPIDSLAISETLWDEAYRTIQKRHQNMVNWYEKILSFNLEKAAQAALDQQRRRSPDNIQTFKNMINQEDYGVRRAQMRDLLRYWLAEIEEEESLHRDHIETGFVVPPLKYIIRKSVETTPPEAVLAWVSACYASKILFHPTVANKDDCSGLIYVITQIEWYSRLLKVVEVDVDNDERNNEVREGIHNLYTAVLSYLMEMVCAHSGTLIFDTFYAPPQDRSLKTVTDAENALPLFNKDHVELPLERLLEVARKERVTSASKIEEPPEENSRLLSKLQPSGENYQLLCKLHVVEQRPGIFNLDVGRSQAVDKLYDSFVLTEQYKNFQNWNKPENQLLWISGSAFEGKTMPMSGTVRRLSREQVSRESDSRCLAFFFFDYTRPDADNDAAALKSLIWLLLVQQPLLSHYLAEKFSSTGREYFDSPNDFLALSAVFYNIIQDKDLSETYFVVDSLCENPSDEERSGRNDLLLLITKSMEMSKKIRWLVSSNCADPVKPEFKIDDCLYLNLKSDLQDPHVAIESYIKSKVSELASVKVYDEELKAAITKALYEQSLGNYLWVDTVCETLKAEGSWYATSILKEVEHCNNLELLYGYMIKNIKGLPRLDGEFCMEVLSTMALVHQPLHIKELKALACLPVGLDLKIVLQKCSCFLQVRDDVVSFLHQEAKNYIQKHSLKQTTISKASYKLTQRCLDYLGITLSKESPKVQDPCLHVAAKPNYASLYSMKHLSEIQNVTENIKICEKVRWFLDNHFLNWVDNLVLRGQLSIAAVRLQKVDLCLPVKENLKVDISITLQTSIRDARLFLRLYQSTNTPKDAHVYNTLLFCPEESIIKKTWMPKVLPWVNAPPLMEQHWDSDFNAFQGHEDWIRAIAFSPDGKLIASGSDDSSVRIWDVETGTTQHTFRVEQRAWVYSVAFSSRGIVAAGSNNKSITLWDSTTGHLLKRLPGQLETINAICFSEDGKKLVASCYYSVRIWDVDSLSTDVSTFDEIEGHKDNVGCVAFSRNGKLLVTGCDDAKIRVWNVETRELRSTFEGHEKIINSVMFSPDMKQIASGSEDGTSGIWDADSRNSKRLQTLISTQRSRVNSVAFSPDGLRLALATENVIDIWNTRTGSRLQVLRSRSFNIGSVAFSLSGLYLASGLWDNAVHIWYAGRQLEDVKQFKQLAEERPVQEMAISPDGRLIAAAQGETVSLWDIERNELLNQEMGFKHEQSVHSLMFSPKGGEMLLSSSFDGTVQVCVVASGDLLRLFSGHENRVRCATWSADEAQVASAADDGSIRIWRIGSKEGEEPKVKGDAHGGYYTNALAFSPNGKYIVSGGNDQKVVVWERIQDNSWERKHSLTGHTDNVVGVVISPDGKRVVSSSLDRTLRIWDIETGEKLQTLIKIEWDCNQLSFDQPSSNYLMTARGIISLDPSSSSSSPPPWSSYCISFDNEQNQWWITWKGRKVIFLPERFRPASCRIFGHKIVIGTNYGRINVYDFSKDRKPSSITD